MSLCSFFSFLCLFVLDGFWLPIDAIISIVFCYERNIILITIRSFLLLINISAVSTAFSGEKQDAWEISNQLFANYFVRLIWMYRYWYHLTKERSMVIILVFQFDMRPSIQNKTLGIWWITKRIGNKPSVNEYCATIQYSYLHYTAMQK